ncbi:amidohydrolase [Sinomicrobium pectinilyticum]|uniref:Amidohydrolase n=1 Tax=Sinomicrobium pectinilyticum TaxID=1084421 RepID=A0A3N0ES92_SINP1|nr:amidohydrolase [Sinomicrobium pectinilyticum]RNL90795.1 amidohydrolase [Sinomicrobium pectinilyticum]
MKKTLFSIAALMLALNSCKKRQPVDIVVTNANVYTVNDHFDKAGSFAIKDGKFIDVGNVEDIGNKYSAREIIDVNGKTVVPGLIDAHCHFYGLGLNRQHVDLEGTASFDEVVERVVVFQKEKQPEVIFGRGWDQNDWEVKEFPEKDVLDSLFPDTPVVLERIDGHAYLVNSKVLQMAGINGQTIVDNGEIVMKNEEPTGVLVDGPMALVDAVLPPPDRKTQVQALLDAQKICFGYGLTTVNDAGLTRETIELIDSLQRMNAMDMRVYAMVSNSKKDVVYFLSRGVKKTDKLHVRSVKVYADGALGSRGAALKAPYTDKPGHYGAMVTPVADIEALALKIAASDFQMNTHAIGDSANVAVLRAYAKALEGKKDRRWKIEHAQVISPEDFDYFEQGIIPSVQPTHATSDMYWAQDRLGKDRVQGAYAYKTLLDKAGVIALGTDFPVEHVNPFYTFYAAVGRKDLDGYPNGGFQPENALSRKEALKGMTIWAAYSNFEEEEKGSIETGKLADFIILDKDIMQVPLEEIPATKVEGTFIGGKKVY